MTGSGYQEVRWRYLSNQRCGCGWRRAQIRVCPSTRHSPCVHWRPAWLWQAKKEGVKDRRTLSKGTERLPHGVEAPTEQILNSSDGLAELPGNVFLLVLSFQFHFLFIVPDQNYCIFSPGNFTSSILTSIFSFSNAFWFRCTKLIRSTYEIEASSKKVEDHLVLTRTWFCFSVLSSCNFLRISSASFSCCEGLVVSALVTCIEQGLPDSSDSWGPYLLRARCYDDSIFQIFPLPLKDNDINEWGNDRKTALSPYPYSPSSTILSK